MKPTIEQAIKNVSLDGKALRAAAKRNKKRDFNRRISLASEALDRVGTKVRDYAENVSSLRETLKNEENHLRKLVKAQNYLSKGDGPNLAKAQKILRKLGHSGAAEVLERVRV